MNNVLLLTIGLPRSGKSTWARATGYPVVNPDSIRLALHGQDFYAPAEPMVWAMARLMVSALFKAGHKVVVLDATNITEQRRREWHSKDWNYGYVCFRTEKEECIRRARSLEQFDLIEIIERMARDLEWPEGEPSHATPAADRFLHYIPDAKSGPTVDAKQTTVPILD